MRYIHENIFNPWGNKTWKLKFPFCFVVQFLSIVTRKLVNFMVMMPGNGKICKLLATAPKNLPKNKNFGSISG